MLREGPNPWFLSRVTTGKSWVCHGFATGLGKPRVLLKPRVSSPKPWVLITKPRVLSPKSRVCHRFEVTPSFFRSKIKKCETKYRTNIEYEQTCDNPWKTTSQSSSEWLIKTHLESLISWILGGRWKAGQNLQIPKGHCLNSTPSEEFPKREEPPHPVAEAGQDHALWAYRRGRKKLLRRPSGTPSGGNRRPLEI